MSLCKESGEKPSSNTPEMIKLKSIELSISVVIIIVNAVEIVLLKRQNRKSRFEIVLLSLSVADLLYGFLNSTFQLIRIFEVFSADFQLIFNIRLFFMLASIFHLLLIGTDRLFAVAKPLRNKTVITKKKIYWALFVIWLLSFGGLGLFQIYDNLDSTSEPTASQGKPKPPPKTQQLVTDPPTNMPQTIDPPTNKTDQRALEARNFLPSKLGNETQKRDTDVCGSKPLKSKEEHIF